MPLAKSCGLNEPDVELVRVPLLVLVRQQRRGERDSPARSAMFSSRTPNRLGPILLASPLPKVWHCRQTLAICWPCAASALAMNGPIGSSGAGACAGRSRGCAGLTFGARRQIDRLFETDRVDHALRHDPRHHRDDHRGQHRGNDLVPLERRHRPFRSRRPPAQSRASKSDSARRLNSIITLPANATNRACCRSPPPTAHPTVTRTAPQNPIVMIPARLASTRLPGKPLARHRRRADDRPCLASCGRRRSWAGGRRLRRPGDRRQSVEARADGRC